MLKTISLLTKSIYKYWINQSAAYVKINHVIYVEMLKRSVHVADTIVCLGHFVLYTGYFLSTSYGLFCIELLKWIKNL